MQQLSEISKIILDDSLSLKKEHNNINQYKLHMTKGYADVLTELYNM